MVTAQQNGGAFVRRAISRAAPTPSHALETDLRVHP